MTSETCLNVFQHFEATNKKRSSANYVLCASKDYRTPKTCHSYSSEWGKMHRLTWPLNRDTGEPLRAC